MLNVKRFCGQFETMEHVVTPLTIAYHLFYELDPLFSFLHCQKTYLFQCKIRILSLPRDPLRAFCSFWECQGKFLRVIYHRELLSREEAEYFNFPCNL